MNAKQRQNLFGLAVYLERLAPSYKHFDMSWFAEHRGDCELPMPEELYAAKEPAAFLSNCGTVACAVGHGPAAGFPVKKSELAGYVNWHAYAERVFGVSAHTASVLFDFLFGGAWDGIDNHHYGAAARIRYFLDTGLYRLTDEDAVRDYAPYRKGSRSAKRRALAAAGFAGDALAAPPIGPQSGAERATPNPSPHKEGDSR